MSKFTLEFDNQTKNAKTINIIDLTGKNVFETTSKENKYEFNGNNIPAGIYIVKVMSDKIYVGKMVVE